MRLKNDHQPSRVQPARRLERGRDLARMVPVVIDDPEVRALVFDLKPPLRAAERFQRAPDSLERHAQTAGQRHHRQCIGNIVAPRNVQHQFPQPLTPPPDRAPRRLPKRRQPRRAEIRLLRKPERDEPPRPRPDSPGERARLDCPGVVGAEVDGRGRVGLTTHQRRAGWRRDRHNGRDAPLRC